MGKMLGRCPMLGAACTAWCGYLVGGACRFMEPDEGTRLEDCAQCDPRVWYVETVAAVAADAL